MIIVARIMLYKNIVEVYMNIYFYSGSEKNEEVWCV